MSLKEAVTAYLEIVDRVGGYSHREHLDALDGLRSALVEKPAREPKSKTAASKKPAAAKKPAGKKGK